MKEENPNQPIEKQPDPIAAWCNAHPFLGLFLSILFLSGVLYAFGSAWQTPESKAINKCISELNHAAGGGLSGDYLRQTCILMIQESD